MHKKCAYIESGNRQIMLVNYTCSGTEVCALSMKRIWRLGPYYRRKSAGEAIL